MLARLGCAAVPVVDEDGRLVGVLSEADVLRCRLDGEPPPRRDRRVAEAMTTEVVVTAPGAELTEVARTLVEGRLRSLPVLNGRVVVGVISRRDLIRALVRADAVIAEEVRHRLADLPGALWNWRLEVADGVVTLDERSAGATGPCVESGQARMVVVGSRGRGRSAGMVLGSTSQSLLCRRRPSTEDSPQWSASPLAAPLPGWRCGGGTRPSVPRWVRPRTRN
ncbi:CBS domain-containing protein [Crossiella sp. CA-258035]|uniref:CBS domain-containing protein n=1 Tax=Crossiella sp. CA-258035 TaxID=2981138 RepID=UPI0024BD0479|nr:CBS domain-containing protein [Crossiella sp. CA-258035]WHT23358.1 CBS domain-containing protein [Crossiella sp. CA-258035]